MDNFENYSTPKKDIPSPNPLESLKARMRASDAAPSKNEQFSGGFVVEKKVTEEENLPEQTVPQEPVAEKAEVSETPKKPDASISDTQQISLKPRSKRVPPVYIPAPEKPAEPKEEYFEQEAAPTENEPEKSENEQNAPSDDTLLRKMKRYTVDEEGNDAGEIEEPAYHLQTVTEILKSGDAEAIANITKNHDVIIDNSVYGDPEEEKAPDATIVFETNEPSRKETEEPSKEENEEQPGKPQKVGFISDIDSDEDSFVAKKPEMSNTSTIRFTPVKNGKVTVSSMTKPINIVDTAPDKIEKNISDSQNNGFEDFHPDIEAGGEKSEKELRILLAKANRSAFITAAISVIFTIVLAFFSFAKSPNMLAVTILFGIVFLANWRMFLKLPKTFGKHCTNEITACLAGISTLFLSVLSLLKNESDVFPVVLCGSIILSFRAITAFFDASALFGNFRIISSKRQKDAVCLIGDNYTTLAMAKNSIEGDVLIAGAKKVNTVTDFMKYSEFSVKLSGKIPIITAVSLAIALLFGVVSGMMQHSAVTGVYSATVILLIAALPLVFFIDSLPLKSAANKLNADGSMITGSAAAERLEQANATVISTADIFPNGTITLEDMKVLSDNNIDDILLRAASLTEAMNSPLCPIFKKIAGTTDAYKIPSSDTVKYEETLGISGWVNDELLFIGNRTLLESHGISVPDVTLDHKILSQGYFPIYVAKDNKPCALIIAKYTIRPSVAKKLQRITELGITLLVENSDPNITKAMICDYFDLYDDSVMIMSSAGVKMYKSATSPVNAASSPAAYRGNTMCLVDIMNAASRIRKSNQILTVLYAIAAVLGTVYFIYAAYTGKNALTNAWAVPLYTLITTVISVIIYSFKKP